MYSISSQSVLFSLSEGIKTYSLSTKWAKLGFTKNFITALSCILPEQQMEFVLEVSF